MSDHDTAPPSSVRVHDPEAPTPPARSTAYEDVPWAGPAAQPTPSWRDRVLGLRGVIAVALASLVVGGFGGWLLGSTTDGSNDRGGFNGPGGQFQRGQLPNGQAPNGQAPNGQAPNGQAPNGQAPNGQLPKGQAPAQ